MHLLYVQLTDFCQNLLLQRGNGYFGLLEIQLFALFHQHRIYSINGREDNHQNYIKNPQPNQEVFLEEVPHICFSSFPSFHIPPFSTTI